MNPTGTHKDRIARAHVEKALEEGFSGITVGTCWNYGASIAYHAAIHGLRAVIFVPAGYTNARLPEMRSLGAEVVEVPGSYEDAVDFVPTAYVLDIETLVQGVGIGSALLERAEEWARLEGARKVSLRVELGNPFLTWYLKRGYRKRALILEKPLQAQEKDSQGK